MSPRIVPRDGRSHKGIKPARRALLTMMDISNAFTIRRAHASDEPTLAWLAALSSKPPLRRPALIGDVDGMPAAAISLVDGGVAADPFQRAPGLETHLRLHRSGWRTGPRRDSARRHLRAAIPFMA